jgi:hypothetical protein
MVAMGPHKSSAVEQEQRCAALRNFAANAENRVVVAARGLRW